MSLFRRQDFEEMTGVHAALVIVLAAGAEPFAKLTGKRFGVTSGLRTLEEQKVLKEAGVTPAFKSSRHLSGLAVDLVVLERGPQGVVANWKFGNYSVLNQCLQLQAKRLLAPHYSLTWGGDWMSRDGCHFQLEVLGRD